MRNFLLSLVGLACLLLAFAFYKQSRAHLHRTIAIENRVLEGASIGVVVNQMRGSHLTPIQKDEFLRRYGENFAMKWQVSTNSIGDLLLCYNGAAIWSVGVTDGLVRRV